MITSTLWLWLLLVWILSWLAAAFLVGNIVAPLGMRWWWIVGLFSVGFVALIFVPSFVNRSFV